MRTTCQGHLSQPEAGPHWIKSSRSYSQGSCVEVANLSGGFIGVRDSKDTQGPILKFTHDAWLAFIGGVQDGKFANFDEILA